MASGVQDVDTGDTDEVVTPLLLYVFSYFHLHRKLVIGTCYNYLCTTVRIYLWAAVVDVSWHAATPVRLLYYLWGVKKFIVAACLSWQYGSNHSYPLPIYMGKLIEYGMMVVHPFVFLDVVPAFFRLLSSNEVPLTLTLGAITWTFLGEYENILLPSEYHHDN